MGHGAGAWAGAKAESKELRVKSRLTESTKTEKTKPGTIMKCRESLFHDEQMIFFDERIVYEY